MKKIVQTGKLFLITSLLTLFCNIGYSQNNPIGCNGQFFVTHGSGGTSTSTTSVKKLSFSGSIITANVFNVSPSTIGFNAIGLNPVDGYMYGLRYPTSGNRPNLVRVGEGTPNNIVDLGEVSNGAGNMSDGDIAYAGCFDAAGVFYFITDNNEMFKITGLNYPASTTTVTYVGAPAGGGSGTNFFVDMAINPVTNILYGVTFNQRLYTINTATGVSTFIATHSGSGYIASLFFDEVGNLYGYHQDGSFYLINKTTAALTPAGSGPSYTYADGCSCSFGRVFHDLDFTQNPGNQLCPTVETPNPVFPLTVSVTNQTSSQKTGLTYTLNIGDPKKRFRFTESTATIKANLITAGLATAASTVTLTTVAPATGTNYNNLVVTGFQTGGVNSTLNFVLQVQLYTLGGAYTDVDLQSVISGLPASIGSTDLSNDPTSVTPDDPTTIKFCPSIILPVKLLSFTGTYKNNATLLNWVAENQTNFAHYEIERSVDGRNFSGLALRAATGNSSSRVSYQYIDDLSGISGNVFYYRLKMVDTDGQFKYSNIILIRKDQMTGTDITISPNPVVKGNTATIRFESASKSVVSIQIVDMAGRVILTQQNSVAEGMNSVALNNLDRLLPGMYVLQLNDGVAIQTAKLTIAR